MSLKTNLDPAEKSSVLKEMKEHETEGETESDSDEAFFDGLTKANAESLRAQMSAMATGFSVQAEQRKKDEFQRIKQSLQILNASNLKDNEVQYSIDFCKRHNMNIGDLIEKEGLSFLRLMREMMKGDHELSPRKNIHSSTRTAPGEDKLEETATGSGDEDYVPQKVTKVNRRRIKVVKKRSDSSLKKKPGYNLDGSKRAERILLDDALKTKDTNMTGWSVARKKAYKVIEKNPNAYHYRFNKPGEPSGSGAWTKKEHKQFMKLLLEKGANKNWGLFSIRIPGRVGYQCSNYYRKLVKHYKIWDPNYWFDGKKLYFKRGQERNEAWVQYAFTVLEDDSGVFGKPPAQHPKCPSALPSPEEIKRIASNGFSTEPPEGFNLKQSRTNTKRKSRKRIAPSVRRNRKRIRTSRDSDSDCDIRSRTAAELEALPAGGAAMPKFTDPFTKCLITSPAISPYGHVCEYDMWTKVLRTPGAKDICPFTRKPVTRRQLVKLTPENIDEYKSKVINQDHALKEWRKSC